MWEIAAGREGPADAGPHHGLAPAQKALADFAAALVAADAAARRAQPLAAGRARTESALSALLRAIDTTLWTVDTFSPRWAASTWPGWSAGRSRWCVRSCAWKSCARHSTWTCRDAQRAAEWAQAEAGGRAACVPGAHRRAHAQRRRRARLLRRRRLLALPPRRQGDCRHRGRRRPQPRPARRVRERAPACRRRAPSTHPYIAGTDDADTLLLHIGQTVTLTILMHPAGKATLTSGVLPRKALALARDWVGPGLAAIAPSLRTGPVLVETDLDTEGQVRLPKVSVFGKDQNFLWRDTPATWRTDAILAATQTALLPDSTGRAARGLDPRRADQGGRGRRMSRYQWPIARRRRDRRRPRRARRLLRHARSSSIRPAARAGPRHPASPGVARPRAPANGRDAPVAAARARTPWSAARRGRPRASAGRINVLAVHPDGERVYAASANGGVWYSGDGGAVLAPRSAAWPRHRRRAT